MSSWPHFAHNSSGCLNVTFWWPLNGLVLGPLPSLSMNSLSDSPFSCRMLTRAMEDRWCGQLVVNCIPNLGTRVSKQSMEYRGSLVNQLKAPPFSEVGNTQHWTALFEVYKLMWVVYTSMYSSGSVVPSQWSMFKPFHMSGCWFFPTSIPK